MKIEAEQKHEAQSQIEQGLSCLNQRKEYTVLQREPRDAAVQGREGDCALCF